MSYQFLDLSTEEKASRIFYLTTTILRIFTYVDSPTLAMNDAISIKRTDTTKRPIAGWGPSTDGCPLGSTKHQPKECASFPTGNRTLNNGKTAPHRTPGLSQVGFPLGSKNYHYQVFVVCTFLLLLLGPRSLGAPCPPGCTCKVVNPKNRAKNSGGSSREAPSQPPSLLQSVPTVGSTTDSNRTVVVTRKVDCSSNEQPFTDLSEMIKSDLPENVVQL